MEDDDNMEEDVDLEAFQHRNGLSDEDDWSWKLREKAYETDDWQEIESFDDWQEIGCFDDDKFEKMLFVHALFLFLECIAMLNLSNYYFVIVCLFDCWSVCHFKFGNMLFGVENL